MSLFHKKSKGFMDVIRCDEPSYLIWKWCPAGSDSDSSKRANSIRWGSSLRVKDGEVAVFVYSQSDGTKEDFIEGPFDDFLETKNLPILTGIIGLAYNGNSPFQAEIYFINLSKIIQVQFGVPYFDVYDPRFLDFGVPVAVRGTLSFHITDYVNFIKLHRLDQFDLTDFQNQVRDTITRYTKSVVANAPIEAGMPVTQIERQIATINNMIENEVKVRFQNDFGVTVTGVDIGEIEIDKTSDGYTKLMSVTQDVSADITHAQEEINIKNMQDMQRINSENVEATLKAQREEAQYEKHKQTQMSNFAAFQMDKQAEVGVAGANALGQMGVNGAMAVSGSGGMNPAGMMTGMAIGGAIGKNVAGMMNDMMGGINNASSKLTPPPIPDSLYYVAVNGQATGPYKLSVVSQMIASGSINSDTLMWKEKMESWERAGKIDELLKIFNQDNGVTPPPIPQ